MVENIFFDEVKNLSECMGKYITFFGDRDKIFYETVYIIADRNPVAGYVVPAVTANLGEGNTVVVEAFKGSSVDRNYCEEKFPGAVYVSFESFKNMKKTKNSAYILLCDTNLADEKWLNILDICKEKAIISNTNKLMLGAVMPTLRPIPGGIRNFAEREYSYFIEKTVENRTPAENLYISLEKKCREIVNNGFQKVNVLRFDNLVGSTCAITPNFDFESIVKEAFENGKIEITKEDYLNKFSFVHTRDAACALIKSLYCTRNGHVYNIDLYDASMADLKNQIHLAFPDKISLVVNSGAYTNDEIKSICMSNLKAVKTVCFTKKFIYTFEDAIYRTICSISGNDFDVQTRLTCYQGKLQRLKSIEIDILAEIDRICKKHDIKWFLAGGSLLGAVRENKSIPWDDDLDIGMLREDFEKFKKVAPQELDKKYYYSSPWTDPNCHYYLDKIRLKSSYFSTAYSNHFELEDGVFVDIIVYDQTSSNRLLEKFQIKFIKAMVALLKIRWYNVPRKVYRYRLTKILLPFLRLVPWKVLHKTFDFAATMFSKKKDAEYLLDSTGQHIHYGRFPKYYLEELTETELDGLKVPMPVHYHEYLSFFYGPNYFPKPSLSAQVGAHKFARLDLGEFIFEDKQPGDFREVNIKGELFETEID